MEGLGEGASEGECGQDGWLRVAALVNGRPPPNRASVFRLFIFKVTGQSR
jgi:hypothetical protein